VHSRGSHGARSCIALLEGEVEIDWRIAIHVPEISGKVRLSLRISRSGRKERAPGKENYDKLKNATEEVTGGFKDAYETATNFTLGGR
jgi:hypothetical protein